MQYFLLSTSPSSPSSTSISSPDTAGTGVRGSSVPLISVSLSPGVSLPMLLFVFLGTPVFGAFLIPWPVNLVVFFFGAARGPALPARGPPGVVAFGVPGCSEECRSAEDVDGTLAMFLVIRRLASLVAPADDSRM